MSGCWNFMHCSAYRALRCIVFYAAYLDKNNPVTSRMPTKRSSTGLGYPPTATHLTALGRPSINFSVEAFCVVMLTSLLIFVTVEPLDSINISTAPLSHTRTHTHIHTVHVTHTVSDVLGDNRRQRLLHRSTQSCILHMCNIHRVSEKKHPLILLQ